MTRNRLTLGVSLALAAAFASPIQAADPGFYVVASLGQGSEDPTSNGTNIAFGIPPAGIVHVEPDELDVEDGDIAWGVALGYRINRYLAAEVEYIDFGTTDVSEHYDLSQIPGFPFPTDLTVEYSSNVTGPALSVLGNVPIGQSFDVFLRAGVLFADREVKLASLAPVDAVDGLTTGSTVWLGGVGVDWSFASRWAVRLEYQRAGSIEESILTGETEVDRVSLSALFRL
jgi:opacity protein-like surface antigen